MATNRLYAKLSFSKLFRLSHLQYHQININIKVQGKGGQNYTEMQWDEITKTRQTEKTEKIDDNKIKHKQVRGGRCIYR